MSEEAELFAQIRYDYQPIAYFLLRMGCRRNEAIHLAWRDIDWGNRELKVTGKGNKTRYLPMPEDVYKLLYNLPRADLDHVFTYVVQRGRYKGELRPITPEGFKTQFTRDKGKTDIADFKMHDLRHTAATRIMRAKGNLKLVQRILGHSNIETTTRYAHVVKNDILDGFEATSPTKSPTENIIQKINDKIQEVK
ncbi:MAG: site-specific integrase [Lentilitoribacter sp.]